MKNKSVVLVIIALVVVGAVLAAVALGGNDNNSSTDTNTTDTPASTTSQNDSNNANADTENAVATDEVEIEDQAFSPATITVKVGTTVTWTNKDSVQHDVVADELSDDAPNSDLLSRDESYSFTFNKAGTYTYHCTPHSFMKGTVIVTE